MSPILHGIRESARTYLRDQKPYEIPVKCAPQGLLDLTRTRSGSSIWILRARGCKQRESLHLNPISCTCNQVRYWDLVSFKISKIIKYQSDFYQNIENAHVYCPKLFMPKSLTLNWRNKLCEVSTDTRPSLSTIWIRWIRLRGWFHGSKNPDLGWKTPAKTHANDFDTSFGFGARPTNDIFIELEIRPKFAVLWFKMYCADHNAILHTSRPCNGRYTVVRCAKLHCDRLSIFCITALEVLIEFRIRSKHR